MKKYSDARDIAYIELSKSETINILKPSDLKANKLEQFNEVWEIEKSVSVKGVGKPLTFYVCLKFDFPFSVPSIYLSKESYSEIKYIPHVDTDFLICLFDSESAVTNPEDPAGIVDFSLKKARTIIEAGLEKINQSDFIVEFLSYWENKYVPKDFVNLLVLSFIEENPSVKPVKLLSLEKAVRKFEYILWQENEEAVRFKLFLDEQKIKYSESDIFYIDENIINDFPPFNFNCKQTIEMVGCLGGMKKQLLKEYLNNGFQKKLVLVRKNLNNQDHFIGWFYPSPILNRPGFRPGKIKPFDTYSSFQSADLVHRISPTDYTKKRLQKRSKGDNVIANHKFFVAGLGSVGSNLIYFLNSLNSPEFRLVDYDLLTLENTERHLLGFDKVNSTKVAGMKNYLKMINPKQEVKIKEESILSVFGSDLDFINDSDFLFIAVGKWNVEKFIFEELKEKKITKPVFILWVEPYLAGGHCIYIHPDNLLHDSFYENINGLDLFKYNAISSDEYVGENKLLTMKEASCQTTYVPYSGSNVVTFLSQMYPKILKTISKKSKESVAWTWLGDLDEVKGKKIKLSVFAEKHGSFEIIENIG